MATFHTLETAPTAKPDALRERASHLVNRLQGVHRRLAELHYNIAGALDEPAPQQPIGGNPEPLPPISASTMKILALVGEIEIILTDLEGAV